MIWCGIQVVSILDWSRPLPGRSNGRCLVWVDLAHPGSCILGKFHVPSHSKSGKICRFHTQGNKVIHRHSTDVNTSCDLLRQCNPPGPANDTRDRGNITAGPDPWCPKQLLRRDIRMGHGLAPSREPAAGQDDCKVREFVRRGGRWSVLSGRRSSWLAGALTSGVETILPGAERSARC